MTPLDQAYLDGEGDETLRLRFFERLAATELFLLLEAEAEGDQATPRVIEEDGAAYVLGFDLEERLSTFVEGPAPFVALSGRAMAGLLAGEGLGLALNLGEAPSAQLLPPEAMAWFAQMLASEAQEASARPVEVSAPKAVPDSLLSALDARLASAAGLARFACLASVRYADDTRGSLLAVVDAVPGAERALVQVVNEALVFCGLDAAVLDVAFFKGDDPLTERIARVGLRFDLPDPVAPLAERPAPGSDPDKPPKLR